MAEEKKNFHYIISVKVPAVKFTRHVTTNVAMSNKRVDELLHALMNGITDMHVKDMMRNSGAALECSAYRGECDEELNGYLDELRITCNSITEDCEEREGAE